MTVFSGMEFEPYVRSITSARWNVPREKRNPEFFGNNEVDCVIRTEDFVVLIECTTQRQVKKIRIDAQKISRIRRSIEQNGELALTYIVTLHEPTADQVGAARENNVTIESIYAFEAALMDAQGYLNSRLMFRFGSATDPETDSHTLPADEYVPIPFTKSKTDESLNVNEVLDALGEKQQLVLLGEFGAGKSLSVREIYQTGRRRFLADPSSPIPVAINLRDHWGQVSPDEVFSRHANLAGFDKPSHLLRGWNGGRIVLLLDGFDELATPLWGRQQSRYIRRNALAFVRRLVKESTGNCGVLITGRDHYFDSETEMKACLGLRDNVMILNIREFSDDAVASYLRKKGHNGPLPGWLPRRPLLLGYLAARGLLNEVLKIPGDRSPAAAWNELLTRICDREADLADDIDGISVRHILEKLATRARATNSGVGPLYEADLSEEYRTVTGVTPGDQASVLLQRLPGLTAREQEEGARSFVDDDMMNALAGGDVAAFIASPYEKTKGAPIKYALNSAGIELASILAGRQKSSMFIVAAEIAKTKLDEPSLAIDCLLAGSRADLTEALDCENMVISDALIDELDFSASQMQRVHLETCLINQLDISEVQPIETTLSNCAIQRVIGAAGLEGMPDWIKAVEVGTYDNVLTTSSIVSLDLPLGGRVMLSILKKLYLQRGSGRVDSALRRGLPPEGTMLVDSVLSVLVNEMLAYPVSTGNLTIWHGTRANRDRALRLLAAPRAVSDSALQRCMAL